MPVTLNKLTSRNRFLKQNAVAIRSLLHISGRLILQADVASADYAVVDSADPTTVIYSTSLVPSSIIFDTLQQDLSWTADDTGYNLKFTAHQSGFPASPKLYWVELKLTLAAGGTAGLLWEVPTSDRPVQA